MIDQIFSEFWFVLIVYQYTRILQRKYSFWNWFKFFRHLDSFKSNFKHHQLSLAYWVKCSHRNPWCRGRAGARRSRRFCWWSSSRVRLREGDWVDINKDKNSIFSIGLDNDNILKWNIAFSGPSDTLLEVRSSYLSPQGGYYQAQLLFPDDFPNNPPKMKFLTQMWHPNISKEGNVCISILHASGEDQLNQ